MAETLGSLLDKLTVVKLKQWHTEKSDKLQSLKLQEKQLIQEIDEFMSLAIRGYIIPERLTFTANKVYPKFNESSITGSIGEIIAKLADANSKVWHEQEKAYNFDSVPVADKDQIVKNLMVFNLERSRYIDQIDILFRNAIISKGQNASNSS
jgi:hypothetical protein